MKRLEIHGGEGDSTILIGERFQNLRKYIDADRTVMITDSNVRKTYLSDDETWEVVEIGTGEAILPGNFIAPHGLWADSEGSLYVGEVTQASGGGHIYAPDNPLSAHCFQKFIRRG